MRDSDGKKRKLSGKQTQLSEKDKKANHIASEQKRRQAIREAYEKLVEIVPNLSSENSRSEPTVLKETIDYINELLDEKVRLEIALGK